MDRTAIITKAERLVKENHYSVQGRTLDEVVEMMVLCAEISEELGTLVEANKNWGKTREQIVEETKVRIARNKPRAGVKALVKKYGYIDAERILEKHAGRHISIKRS